MKRRRFVQSIVAAPAASALFMEAANAQQAQPPGNPANPAPSVPQNPARGGQPPGTAAQELPRLDASVPDVAADTTPKFFTQPQFEALEHLCQLLQPALESRPGAVEARAPEFLDFLIGESPAERKELYRTGLDALNAESGKRYRKPFAATTPAEADVILAPLRQSWQYNPPTNVLARFLVAAKADVRTATVNSREYVAAAGRGGSRRMGGIGLYWYSLD